MATPRARRPKGSPLVQLHVYVAPEVRERINHLAATAGVPKWAIVEAAVMHGAENDGVPPDWDISLANGQPLPIDGLEEKSA